jgi:hypothetical protein
MLSIHHADKPLQEQFLAGESAGKTARMAAVETPAIPSLSSFSFLVAVCSERDSLLKRLALVEETSGTNPLTEMSLAKLKLLLFAGVR